MRKRKHVLGLMIMAKLELGQPLSEIEQAYVDKKPRGKYKKYNASKRNHGFLGTKPNLRAQYEKVPSILFRATTLTGKRHTNGFTTSTLYIPSASLMGDLSTRQSEDETSRASTSITDIPLQVLRPMLGHHLLWRDRVQDELLSWTVYWPFAVIHLYLRHLKGQGLGYLSPINRFRASQRVKWHVEQVGPQPYEPVRFDSANDLCDYTGIYHDHDWECKRDLPGLHPRKTNHEYITHGPVEYPENDRLTQVAWADLAAAGLFELVPEIKVPPNHKAMGLYTVLRYLRTQNFSCVYATTDRELEIAQDIAWLHTRQDLDENLHQGFGRFPSNLPEMHSLYHLAVDVQSVVNGPPLDALVLTDTYSRFILPPGLERDDSYFDGICVPKLSKEPDTNKYKTEGKCGCPCDSTIWGPTYKRKQANGTDEADDPDDPDDPDNADKPVDKEQSQGPSHSKCAESLGKSKTSRSWEHHEMERTSGLRSQRHSMHEELNPMLLTYKYVSKTKY
ncbi:hypothetical protein QM012_003137 [Aureobasidium pullulans]|uniref:Uncharacterized protein n=1 Tax=Aureobasidium pullulans TaxID=5580 RepID=A0ABR0T9D1_AURPU